MMRLLLLLVVLSPLPLGSNREWSWSLAALLTGLVLLLSTVGLFRQPSDTLKGIPPMASALFLSAVAWILLQMVSWTPAGWHHPLWQMSGEILRSDEAGMISLSRESGWTALMRLLAYAAVFLVALQLGRDRHRATRAFAVLAVAGFAYGLFGLWVYWGGIHPEWLFGSRSLPADVRSTFVNRNHFATWQGLTILCAVAWYHQKVATKEVKPYQLPQDTTGKVEEFVMQSWKPMSALLLMVTALILTHSRGGFVASLAGIGALVLLLDRRSRSRKVRSRLTVISAAFVACIAFYLTSEVLLDRINRTDISNEERMEVFVNIQRASSDNPVLGFGYGTFADSFRLYDQNEEPVHYDRAHNTWLENLFEMGVPAAVMLFLSIALIARQCFRGVWNRHRDWVFPATGVAATILVSVHALVDFSLQIPAIAIMYACILGIALAQSQSSIKR